jgi:hypothetical protein
LEVGPRLEDVGRSSGCARWIAGAALPDHAEKLSPERYRDRALIAELSDTASKGVL